MGKYGFRFMIWDEKIEAELAGLGRIVCYTAGAWLPESVQDRPVIRHILSGHVDIHAIKQSRPVLIARYGPGEILGIRSNIYPQEQPRSHCRAVSNIECREILWETIEALSTSNARLESLMQHIARMRVYSTAIAMHPVFSCLYLDERRRLFEHVIVRLLSPGDHLIRRQGGRAHLYLLMSGSVDVRSDGRSIARRSKGDILGEISLFGYSIDPTADVVAEGVCEILEFEDSDLLTAMSSNPVFKMRIRALVASRTQPE